LASRSSPWIPSSRQSANATSPPSPLP